MSDAEQKNKIVKVLKNYPGITANMDLSTSSALVVDIAKAVQPTHPVDGEIDNQIENILDDFGHDVVNNPESSRRSLQAKPKRLLKELHNTHLQAAVREAERKAALQALMSLDIDTESSAGRTIDAEIARLRNKL